MFICIYMCMNIYIYISKLHNKKTIQYIMGKILEYFIKKIQIFNKHIGQILVMTEMKIKTTLRYPFSTRMTKNTQTDRKLTATDVAKM